jgi:1-acyl-sn-glycerol-3-phosphate acyltransferase
MLAAFGEDLAASAGGRGERDPFKLRDPAYIERTLPAIRLASELYFRADVRGLGHIPAEGPVLLVGNHSGGTLIADTFVFGQYFYDRFGAERRFHQLAHDLVFKLPGLRALLERYGTVPASPANMTGALRRAPARVVWPGGRPAP